MISSNSLLVSVLLILGFVCSLSRGVEVYEKEQSIRKGYAISKFHLNISDASSILLGSGVRSEPFSLPPTLEKAFTLRLHSLLNASNSNNLELWLEAEGKATGTLYLNTRAEHRRFNDSVVFSSVGENYANVSAPFSKSLNFTQTLVVVETELLHLISNYSCFLSFSPTAIRNLWSSKMENYREYASNGVAILIGSRISLVTEYASKSLFIFTDSTQRTTTYDMSPINSLVYKGNNLPSDQPNTQTIQGHIDAPRFYRNIRNQLMADILQS